jgi:hypothetical protein
MTRLFTNELVPVVKQDRQRVTRHETVRYSEHFLGALSVPDYRRPAPGYPWVKRIEGASRLWSRNGKRRWPAVFGTPNAPHGLVTIGVDPAARAQSATLYWGDNRNIMVDRSLAFESGIKIATVPTGGTRFVAGFAGAWNADPDAIECSAWVRLDGSGEVFAEMDDGETDIRASTGIVVEVDYEIIFRIDCRDLSDIKFFACVGDHGRYTRFARICADTRFAWTERPMTRRIQPFFSAVKSANSGEGLLQVDYVRFRASRDVPASHYSL